jgi:phosphatidyl-myo-inositol dimannoside synthase
LDILFLTLRTFSATGGIEKVCRVAGKAIYEYVSESGGDLRVYSMHDSDAEATAPYLPKRIYRGLSGNKPLFVLKSVLKGVKSRAVIMAHINLLLPGYIIKLFSPGTKLVLVAHGIEVWKPASRRKKKMLSACDLILPVSHFSKEKMKTLYALPDEKFSVLNNCLDPYLPPPADGERRRIWRGRYLIGNDDIVVMTLSRLSSHEINKGYDKILVSIKQLREKFPNLKYLFVGKYDNAEKARLDRLIHDLGIKDSVIFTGFVPDHELADHYNICDVYIMPSEKEGFGISFIEAMYYGKPVIAGNRDGTTDALLNGRLGMLIDPRSQEEITNAIERVITNVESFTPNTELLMQHFGYGVYKNKWRRVLEGLEVEG